MTIGDLSLPRLATRATPPVRELRALFDGWVVAPDDASYDEARTVFYGGIDRRPAAVVRPANAMEVSRAISFARDTGLELAVRSGGHSVAGHSVSDGGIVLDLREMRALHIDAQRRTAWAETGLTAGEYTTAAAAYGLATGFGDTGSVGIGGLTLGGGGNFGVATRFQFRLHEVNTIVGGLLLLPATPGVIASFIAEAQAAPEELSTIANVMSAPPMPFIPAEYHGRIVLMAMLVYAGPVEPGQRAVAPFRALAAPIADMVRPMTYPEIYPPEPADYHPTAIGRNLFVERIDRDVAETIIDRLEASDAQLRVAQLRVLGGAMARVPVEATAFAHRRSPIMVNVAAFYNSPEDRAVREAWVVDFAAALHQGDSGAYVNFLGDEGEARVRAAFPGATWDRLAAIKARYDPDNLFHLNHNIPPADGYA